MPSPEEIRQLLAAVETSARRHSVSVAAAVVDRTGRLIALQVMPGTLLTSDRVAVGKAFAAATFGRSTRQLGEQIPAETRQQLTAIDGRPCFVVGGLPILRGGLCLGGLGISGGPADLDERLAQDALALVFGGPT